LVFYFFNVRKHKRSQPLHKPWVGKTCTGKIPWTVAGREVWRKQVEEANKQDIPIRLVRTRQKDGKEVEYLEKSVKARDCDVEGCTSNASETIASPFKRSLYGDSSVFLSLPRLYVWKRS
jgi:hypothetical protein